MLLGSTNYSSKLPLYPAKWYDIQRKNQFRKKNELHGITMQGVFCIIYLQFYLKGSESFILCFRYVSH